MTSIAEKLQNKSPRRPGASKQVRLRLVHIDLWSALKVSAIFGFILGVIGVIVPFVVYQLLETVGLFDRVDTVLRDVLAQPAEFSVTTYISLQQVMMFSLLVAVLNFVVIALLGAVLATIYNASTRITGGLQVGFANQ